MSRSLVGALVAVVLLASSCAKRGAAPVPELVLWTPWPVEAVEPLARAYESEAAGVRVRVVAQPTALADSLLAAIAAGTPPDLCVLGDDEVPALLARDALTDWSAGVADLRAGLRGWDLCRVGDAIYGLPLRLRPQVLVVHPAALARLGRTSPPATLADLRALATRRAARGPHVLGLPPAPHAHGR
ncbi:MAG: ABC transporter substrate-binding protein, partial [bacterium]